MKMRLVNHFSVGLTVGPGSGPFELPEGVITCGPGCATGFGFQAGEVS